jgi:hypothetical protein
MNLFDKYSARLRDLSPADSPKIVESIPEKKPERGALSECSTCHENAWWESHYGRLICGVCHPPMPRAVKKWIGGPDVVVRMKDENGASILSLEELRRRKEARTT